MPSRSRASTAMRCIRACWAISMSESTAGLFQSFAFSNKKAAEDSAAREKKVRRLAGRTGLAVFRVDHGRAAGAVADQLQNDFLVLGAIVMVSARRVLHEAPRLDRHGRIRIEGVTRPCPPCALDYDGVAVVRMIVRPRHEARRKFYAHDVYTGFGRIARDHGRLHAVISRRVLPFDVFRQDTDETVLVGIGTQQRSGNEYDCEQQDKRSKSADAGHVFLRTGMVFMRRF